MHKTAISGNLAAKTGWHLRAEMTRRAPEQDKNPTTLQQNDDDDYD